MHLASTLDYAKGYYRYWHSTYPHMKERLLVGVLLKWEVQCTGTNNPLKTAVLPSKMARTTRMM